MYCSNSENSDTYWFGSYINSTDNLAWPMEPGIGNDSKSMAFTFSELHMRTLVEHLFTNTDGFAIHLDDLHPWYIQRMTYGSPERAYFCFSLKSSTEPYLKPEYNQYPTHEDKYWTFKFRIFMGKDIRAVYQAATGNSFAYIKRPLTFDRLLFESVIWNVEDTSIVAQKPVNDSGTFEGFLKTLKMISPSDEKILFNFHRFWHADNIFQLDENMFSHDIATFIANLTNQNAFLCLTVPLLLSFKLKNDNIKSNFSRKEEYLNMINNLSSFKVPSFRLSSQTVTAFEEEDDVHLLTKYPTLLKTTSLEAVYSAAGQRSLMTPFVSKSTRFATPVLLTLQYNPAIDEFDTLPALLKQILTLSLAGYSLAVPQISAETLTTLPKYSEFLKFLQVAIFSPGGLYLSIPYWKLSSGYSKEQQQTVENLLKIHRKYLLPLKMDLAEKWLKTGEPILRPMWYAAPNDPNSWPVVDQFMLGPNVLPLLVFKNYTSERRTVYLPPGKWTLHVNGIPTNVTYEIPAKVLECFPQILQNLTADKVYYLTRVVT